MFHGAGVMTHASGIVYRGDWVNGFPITMATKIVLIEVPDSPMIIRQGQPFSIRVECRNDEDEIVEGDFNFIGELRLLTISECC